MATRWGIVSAGKISHDFVSCLRSLPKDEHQVVAVAAKNASLAEKFAKLHEIPKAYGSYEELAKDANIEVAYIGVINIYHYSAAKMLLEHGKHVLCEKPCTLTLKHTQELTKLAREKKLFFMEAIWSRFMPIYQELRKRLNGNDIGDIQYVHASFGQPLLEVERLTKKSLGGSTILDIGIYCLNLVQFVYGDIKPLKIAAVGHLSPEGVDESIAVSLQYSNNRLANVTTSAVIVLPNEGEMVGSKGSLKLLNPFWCPTKLQTSEKTIEIPLPETVLPCNFINSSGLRYEAMEVRRCLKEGLIESPVLKHEHSETLAYIMDEIRRQLGVQFDVDT